MPHLLHHLLDATTESGPDREAVVDRDRRISYGDLHRMAESLAARLSAAGLERRDRVAVFLDKCAEECAAMFGISRADGVAVPVNGLLRAPQVAHIIQDCSVRILVTSARRWNAIRETVSALPELETVVFVDPDGEGGGAFDPTDERAPEPKAVGEDLAAILYTSGSTGRPKGVMLSHRNLLSGSRIVIEYLGIRPQERILSVLPFSFDYGLNQLVTSVEKGATLVLLTFRFGDEIVRAIERERVTGMAGVPTVWAVLGSAAPTFRKKRLDSLRYFTNSGGSVPTETLERIRAAQPHVDFVLMYGLTEAFRSTYLPPRELERRPTSIGKAIPETEVFVYNEQESRLCEPGEAGVLVHRGPTVSLGYWNRPEETARVIRPNPLLSRHEGADPVCFSGDSVRMDEDGFLYFVGRDDAMIKSSGYRISPSEVEEVLMATGELAQAAVIGVPDPAVGQRVHAVCVPEEGADEARILARCARDLPPHMVPRAIEFVPELPRSPNGKVDYKLLSAERERSNRS